MVDGEEETDEFLDPGDEEEQDEEEAELDSNSVNSGALRPFQSAYLMDVLPEIPEADREQETIVTEQTKRNSNRSSLR